jgi:hypothetical protein
MKIIINEKVIKRNKKIGQITTIGSLAILGVGLYLSFTQNLINLSFAALVLGFLLSQVGIYFGSRWGRSPRPDEMISKELKGLDDKYSLYHYTTPVSHLLVGPCGILVLAVYNQGGTITYNGEKKRYQQKGGNVYLKLFAQESLGRPELDVKSFEKDLTNFFSKKLDDENKPAINSVILFTNEKAEIQAQDAPVPTMAIDKLKDFVRRKAKQEPVSQDLTDKILKIYPESE